MFKKVFLAGGLAVFVFLASGCGTVSKGSCGFAQGVKEGAKEDWNWLARTVNNSDNWVKANLW